MLPENVCAYGNMPATFFNLDLLASIVIYLGNISETCMKYDMLANNVPSLAIASGNCSNIVSDTFSILSYNRLRYRTELAIISSSRNFLIRFLDSNVHYFWLINKETAATTKTNNKKQPLPRYGKNSELIIVS